MSTRSPHSSAPGPFQPTNERTVYSPSGMLSTGETSADAPNQVDSPEERSYLSAPLFSAKHLLPISSSEHTQHEENLPTKPAQARPHPWFSCQERDPKWAQGPRRSPGEGACSPHPLNGESSAQLPAASPPAGLPPARRLCKAEEFRRVFERPRRLAGNGLTVLVRRGTTPPGPRLGLAISKRCARRAVDRNRIKRITRESFRNRAVTLPPVDVVVVCARDVLQLSQERLRETLENAWDRIGGLTWDDS
jgi:ribonuclease P protein component